MDDDATRCTVTNTMVLNGRQSAAVYGCTLRFWKNVQHNQPTTLSGTHRQSTTQLCFHTQSAPIQVCLVFHPEDKLLTNLNANGVLNVDWHGVVVEWELAVPS